MTIKHASLFSRLPEDVQAEKLQLLDEINQKYLHCEDKDTWSTARLMVSDLIAHDIFKKEKKALKPTYNALEPVTSKKAELLEMTYLSTNNRKAVLRDAQRQISSKFNDETFTQAILDALQDHILIPLNNNANLAAYLTQWISTNACLLPLGTLLLNAFKKDMEGSSSFVRHVFDRTDHGRSISAKQSQECIDCMNAFLTDVTKAHASSYRPPDRKPATSTAVFLSLKNGAGGHTSPTLAMEKQLKDRGWQVHTIYYDTDLSEKNDLFRQANITFEDGTPMTADLLHSKWNQQNRNKHISKIIRLYVSLRAASDPSHFKNNSGRELLERIRKINPHLIITTSAYHWSWTSLAYRYPTAKTILVASDVYLDKNALDWWYRQLDIPAEHRKVHFTTMTDDLELLKNQTVQHDRYHLQKYGKEIPLPLALVFNDFKLDSQISVIGAPIHQGFNLIVSDEEILRLKQKWGVPTECISICISRGKLGSNEDMVPALNGYKNDELYPKPLMLHVVCGENQELYERIQNGEFANLGKNITIKAYRLLPQNEFAELRSISMIDDIKAGGGSTFEGWYLRSRGVKTMLLLTPGKKLWWERANCLAMEKWGVGRTVPDDANKTEIVKELINHGPPTLTHAFTDWTTPFNQMVDNLL